MTANISHLKPPRVKITQTDILSKSGDVVGILFKLAEDQIAMRYIAGNIILTYEHRNPAQSTTRHQTLRSIPVFGNVEVKNDCSFAFYNKKHALEYVSIRPFYHNDTRMPFVNVRREVSSNWEDVFEDWFRHTADINLKTGIVEAQDWVYFRHPRRSRKKPYHMECDPVTGKVVKDTRSWLMKQRARWGSVDCTPFGYC